MRLVVLIVLATLLAGCTTGGKVQRSQLDFPVVSSVNGVSNQSAGNVDIVGEGLDVRADKANSSVIVSLPNPLVLNGTIVTKGGYVIDANGSFQYLRWDAQRGRFELSQGVDALGNVTARHHVGTVTTIVLSGGQVANVATAATEGNEATVFLRGSGKLANGTARIDFPAAFKVLVSGNLTAQVTPTSHGQALMVSEKANDHILVETVTGASSDQTFDYFVQATRAASEDFQTVVS